MAARQKTDYTLLNSRVKQQVDQLSKAYSFVSYTHTQHRARSRGCLNLHYFSAANFVAFHKHRAQLGKGKRECQPSSADLLVSSFAAYHSSRLTLLFVYQVESPWPCSQENSFHESVSEIYAQTDILNCCALFNICASIEEHVQSGANFCWINMGQRGPITVKMDEANPFTAEGRS